jgi:hypothetical protein
MAFSDLILKTIDDKPGYFQVVYDVQWWTSGKPFKNASLVMTVPGGYLTDLASIPAPLRMFFSKTGRSRKPAVFHDWMYGTKYRTRKECDQIFKRMLIERGMSRFSANFYYLGVRSMRYSSQNIRCFSVRFIYSSSGGATVCWSPVLP